MIRTVSDLSFLVWGMEGCRVLHGEVVREQQLVWAKHCAYRWWVVLGRLTCLQVAAPSVRLFRCVWSCATYINSLQHQTDATGVSLKHTPHHTLGKKKKKLMSLKKVPKLLTTLLQELNICFRLLVLLWNLLK